MTNQNEALDVYCVYIYYNLLLIVYEMDQNLMLYSCGAGVSSLNYLVYTHYRVRLEAFLVYKQKS